MIRLRDIHLSLASLAGPVHILRGIDLDVGDGETVAVVGPSGSGKSTMMMVIAGLERPSSGQIAVADVDLGKLGEDGLALFRRDHVGIVFQNFHLVPTMTALENVAIPLEFAGRADAFDAAKKGLEAVGLGHRLDHYPAQLSGGEQQRVALARALVHEPLLVLADEPTGNLDEETGAQMMALLARLTREQNGTLLVVTHSPEAASHADRILRLSHGQLVADAER